MKKDLIEVLTLLDSIGALQLVKRYGRRTQAALVAWLCERCRTVDAEAPPDERVAKLLPTPQLREGSTDEFYDGLTEWVMADAWARGNSFDFPKSRGIRCTLDLSALSLNEALFVGGTRVYIISETDSKSRDIISKIQYMWDHLDDLQDAKLKPLWEVESYVDELRIKRFCGKSHESEIVGLPQGSSAFRQYGGSVVWIDECGVQQRFRELLQAIGPRARRIICTGTLERNRSYSERCGLTELRSFDGPEMSGVPQADIEVVQ